MAKKKLADFIFSVRDQGIYRHVTLLGFIKLTFKPHSLQINDLYEKLSHRLDLRNDELGIRVDWNTDKLFDRIDWSTDKLFDRIDWRSSQIGRKLVYNDDSILGDSRAGYLDDIFNYQFFLLNKIKENDLKEKIKLGHKVRVLFLVDYSVRFGMESIYREMLNSEIFEPYILVCHARDCLFESENLYFEEAINSYNLFKSLGYNTIFAYDENTKKLKCFEELRADMFFLNDPNLYNISLIKNFYINSRYLSCYINYSMNVVNSYDYHYKNIYINTTWKNFCETYFTYQGHMNANNGINVVLTGYPKLDLYAKDIKDCIIPKKIDNGKKIIIYAPHWTVKVNINLSTFHLYYKYFLNLVKNNSDINFVFKPHPTLVYRLIDTGIMSLEEYNNYIKEWDTLENGIYINEGEYIDLFRKSSCLITDCGSFIAEYLPSEKPCIYLINPENERTLDIIYNKFGKKILDSYYLCYKEDDITHYFNSIIIDGDDSKKEERLKILKTDFINIGTAGKAIVENIKMSLDIK